MIKISQVLLMTAALCAANLSFAQTGASADANVGASVTAPSAMPSTTVSGGAAASTDPYVQKREADSAAKKDYKMRKKMVKAEYKEEKSEAKSDLKGEKRMSARERREALAADKKAGPAKEVIGN